MELWEIKSWKEQWKHNRMGIVIELYTAFMEPELWEDLVLPEV
jgi:hypothetical protein